MMETSQMLELSQGFAQLGRELHGDGDSAAAIHRVVELAVKYVNGCRCASITTRRGKHTQLLAASDDSASQLDRLQTELGEGPSLDAATLDASYVVNDLIHEARWPKFGRLASRATPVRAALAFRLVAGDLAVLTMYSEQAEGFADDAIDTASIFASYASSVVALMEATDHSANLETALQSSREIGIALGVLMAHRKITHDEAFTLLRNASQNLHRKLREVANEVVETGTLPDLPTPKQPDMN